MIFACRNHLQDNNNQKYNYITKLPDAGFQVIRFSIYSQLSGSVPRLGNNHTALSRR
jgi:hypothetical protein